MLGTRFPQHRNKGTFPCTLRVLNFHALGPSGHPAATSLRGVPRQTRPSARSPGRRGALRARCREEPSVRAQGPCSPRASQGCKATRATAGPVRDPRPLPSRVHAASPRGAARVPPARRPQGACLVGYSRSSCRSKRREPSSGGSPKHRLGGCRTSLPAQRRRGLPPPCPGSTHGPWSAPPGPGRAALGSPGRGAPRAALTARAGPLQAAPTDGRFKRQHPPAAGSAARPAQRPCRSRQRPSNLLWGACPRKQKVAVFVRNLL